MRVRELAELLCVTQETIRRDLDKLEEEGRIVRSHGGAVAPEVTQGETPYFQREVINAAEKKRIARAALAFVREHDRIVLDASSTAWYLSAILPNMPLTVLTNSVKVALELAGKEKITVISTGGTLAPTSLSYVGPLAQRGLEHYHADKVFISCKGVHLQRGISESNELQAMVKQQMINIADQVYLLADHTKLGVQALTYVAPLNDVDRLITDRAPEAEWLEQLDRLQVGLVQA